MELKTKSLKIEDWKFEIKELDTDSALKLANVKEVEKAARMILDMSIVGPEQIDWKKVPARIGLKLMEEINKLNGFQTEDFTRVPELLPKAPSGK